MLGTGRPFHVAVAGCALIGASAGGCSFSAGDPQTGFRCDRGESCPPGTTCIDGYCSEQAPGDAGPVCHQGTFAQATRVDGVSTTLFDDWGPTVTADGEEIFFYRPGEQTEIWRGVRDDVSSDFREAGRALAAQSFGADRDPFPSMDGLVLVFASSRPDGLGGHDLWMASRRARDQTFEDPMHLANLSSSADERSPWLSDDLERLYFASNRGGDFEIYLAERGGATELFGEPQLVPSLNSEQDDRWIRLTHDELEAFLTSDRPDTLGLHDLYRCSRDDESATSFSPCENLTALNGALDDVAASPSRDGRQLYMNLDTNLDGGQNADIWLATRDCP